VRRSSPLVDAGASVVQISDDLPGIEPTHICERCGSVFRGRDRFYLRAQDRLGIHGIAVWPHRERRIRIEIGEDGLVVLFDDSASVLIPREETSQLVTDFFRGCSDDRVKAWASRRGFSLTLRTVAAGQTDLVVYPPGPHFILAVTKSWFQRNEIRCTEDGIYHIELTGARPVLFPPAA
jgi:hypothetical protein